jgi:uncharacterized protein
MQWYNEPPQWEANDDTITVTCAPNTDFWRKTHLGFIRDNGHFYQRSVAGNFIAEVKVSGEYQALYDQAGLMLRLNNEVWMKCGIEMIGGVQHVSAVVTRDFSDWNIIPLPQNPPALWMRVTRHDAAIEIHYSLDGIAYAMLRLAYFDPANTIEVGVMVAAPEGEGFAATFENFHVQQA